MSKVTVILPTRNEVQTVGQVIDELKALGLEDVEILVVDYKSTNGTRETALSRGVRLIDEPIPGKGTALQSAFKAAQGEFIIILDADGTYPTRYIPDILVLLDTSGCSHITTYRQKREKDSMSFIHWFGNYSLSLLASVLYGHRVRDVNSGMRGLRKGLVDRLSLTSKGFTVEAEMFTNTCKLGEWKFKEIPIEYKARLDGSQAKLRVWDGFKIGWFLIRRRFGN